MIWMAARWGSELPGDLPGGLGVAHAQCRGLNGLSVSPLPRVGNAADHIWWEPWAGPLEETSIGNPWAEGLTVLPLTVPLTWFINPLALGSKLCCWREENIFSSCVDFSAIGFKNPFSVRSRVTTNGTWNEKNEIYTFKFPIIRIYNINRKAHQITYL